VNDAVSEHQDSDGQDGPRVLSDELLGVVHAVCWLFCVLFSYFIVRPVRETMGTVVGTDELQWLFLAGFLAMFVAVPLYAALVSTVPRRWIVRVVFHFFAACLVGFWLLMRIQDPTVQLWTARVLFVWVSVFGVFSTSVFWSVLADLFSSQQGRRLFGIIASGGTAGAIAGSLMTSQLATSLSTGTLLLLPAVVIEIGLVFAWRLEKQSSAIHRVDPNLDEGQARPQERIDGGGLFAGITHVIKSPYLASICGFLFFVQAFGTLLYFQQAEIVEQSIPVREERTQLFAYLDLGTQLLTLIIQLGISGVILRRLGVSAALVMLPLIYLFGFSFLALSPTLAMLVVAMIGSRSIAYGITVPAREVLFTVVSREDKYKSKNFIDTVVLRGGDTIAVQVVGALRGLGVTMTQLNVWSLPLVALWGGLAWTLGRRQRRLAIRDLPVPIPGQGEGNAQDPGQGDS
jgi:AAA family ATP:ADP antiporter